MISESPPTIRRYVNLITNSDDNNPQTTYNQTYVDTLSIRNCKRCSTLLVWSRDLNNVACPSCGWQPLKKEKQKVKAQEADI
jgi:DNA-directed RNA polymerase subunit RPC12/RpoP